MLSHNEQPIFCILGIIKKTHYLTREVHVKFHLNKRIYRFGVRICHTEFFRHELNFWLGNSTMVVGFLCRYLLLWRLGIIMDRYTWIPSKNLPLSVQLAVKSNIYQRLMLAVNRENKTEGRVSHLTWYCWRKPSVFNKTGLRHTVALLIQVRLRVITHKLWPKLWQEMRNWKPTTLIINQRPW